MRNPKALETLERIESHKPLFDNPEITAMAAICEILQELPDEAARLRVMRWSFGRFGEEFNIQLRAQFYNLFNHVNGFRPTNDFNSVNFGIDTAEQRRRQLEFGLRLIF